ncbi:MotA/TolQ/ExbB proton channel family protein [Salibacter sp.]|jgi:biopolymer transport protein ExbB|uniref:MotA/TolQ/ExbB proton channel family protein n=1 Tax=Salibacter sp. TaxID=2010995 RepID=UPI002870720D|nr:MotA/TolQ/ExbB proton channel family protein [Salibacter sp.]MDR9399186.1 MotA/TolQ/ExbB proton channel family protein [Salibacter sp.]MDR9487962.1 MotA/TolQ/ExbB proton channel family protein [Salibacter sp.]
MKKLFALMALAGFLTFGATAYAQEGGDTSQTEATMNSGDSTMASDNDTASSDTTAMADESEATASTNESEEAAAGDKKKKAAEEPSFHQVVKDKFIEGGPGFMSFVVICLILGLAIAIERILYLSLATTNTKKLLEETESALNNNGVDAAKEVCRNTRGPVASIFYQGLDRFDEGVDMVEKSVVSYGSVQVGQMEKGVSWISLFIALAPMLGFFGTVIGMIQAFDAIAEANNISPGIVAGGIGVALITTVSGLLVAMILQVFYNYIIAKIDGITNDMEDASIALVDLIVKYNAKNK